MTEGQVEQPFWSLLRTSEWQTVDREMKEAIDLRDTGGPDPAFHAAKALESAIKIISDSRNWTTGNERGAVSYLDNLRSRKNGEFIAQWEHDILRRFFAAVRNPSAHGAGERAAPELVGSANRLGHRILYDLDQELIRRERTGLGGTDVGRQYARASWPESRLNGRVWAPVLHALGWIASVYRNGPTDRIRETCPGWVLQVEPVPPARWDSSGTGIGPVSTAPLGSRDGSGAARVWHRTRRRTTGRHRWRVATAPADRSENPLRFGSADGLPARTDGPGATPEGGWDGRAHPNPPRCTH